MVEHRFTILRALPAAILIVVAVTQWILAATVPISPWIGGGFGMFATVDGRHRVVTVDGQRVDSPVANSYAVAPFQSSADDLAHPALDGSVVKVWAPTFDPEGGQVTFTVVASHTVP